MLSKMTSNTEMKETIFGGSVDKFNILFDEIWEISAHKNGNILDAIWSEVATFKPDFCP